MDVYTVKTGSSKDTTFPLGSKVLREILKCVSDPRYHVLFMGFFTPCEFRDLRTLGVRAIGKVREAGLKKCPLEEMKESDKYESGSCYYECEGKFWL
jgi:hypothetical protein